MNRAQMLLVVSTAESDRDALKAQDEANRHRKHGAMSKSLLEPARPRATNAVLPLGTVVTRCEPGVARGLEPQRIRAVGGVRLPPPETRAVKVERLRRMAKGLNQEQLARARRLMGL